MIPDHTPPGGYESKGVSLHWTSNMSPSRAEALIGKIVARIVGEGCRFRLTFTDGSWIAIEPPWLDGKEGLQLEYEFPDPPDEDTP